MLSEIVSVGLDSHAVDDGLTQGEIIISYPQYGEQTDRIVLAETGIKLPLGGNPDTIAGVTEIVAMR